MTEIIGLVGGIQRFSTSDGPGIRTTVFLKGCPLDCAWCHNPELIPMPKGVIFNPDKCIGCHTCTALCPKGAIHRVEDSPFPAMDWKLCGGCQTCAAECPAEALNPVGNTMTVQQVLDEVIRDKGFYEKSGGGVTLSGGEMLSQPDFARALQDACLAADIPVTLDTSGCGDGDVLFEMAKKAQCILFDMKHLQPEEHKKLTGLSNERILQNLARLAADEEIHPRILMRMPLVKGVNDQMELMEATRDFYLTHGLGQVTLLPYHELGISKARHMGKDAVAFEPPEHEHLAAIRKLFCEAGIEAEILGEEDSDRK